MKDLIILLTFAILFSCGNGSFSGNTNKSEAETDSTGASGEASISRETPTPDIPNQRVEKAPISEGNEAEHYKKCSQNFGKDAPLHDGAEVKKIYAAVSVLNRGFGIVDEEITSTPQVTLIYASVNVLSNIEYFLGNPNGYYCIISQTNVMSNLTVKIHQKAVLAANKVDVSVGGTKDQSIAVVDVDVGSEIKVERFD